MFTDGAGAAGDGWYFTCGCPDATVAPGAKDFTAAYKAKFNTDPSTYSPEAYDATNAMIEAIKAAKDGGEVTRESVSRRSTRSTTRASPRRSSSRPTASREAGGRQPVPAEGGKISRSVTSAEQTLTPADIRVDHRVTTH